MATKQAPRLPPWSYYYCCTTAFAITTTCNGSGEVSKVHSIMVSAVVAQFYHFHSHQCSWLHFIHYLYQQKLQHYDHHYRYSTLS